MRPILTRTLAAGLLLAAIPSAQAHPGIGLATGFEGGLAHPFSGWDHLLAMIAVGYWAGQMRSRLVLASVFLLAMIGGAFAGHWIGPVPGLEQAIAASVLVLGLLIARKVQASVTAGAIWVGAFAVLHGAAHGAEMPATAGGIYYGLGFVLATAMLLVAGIAAEDLAELLPGRNKAAPGWAFAAAGLVLLLMTCGIRT